VTRSQFTVKLTPSQRFHDWLSVTAARALGRIGPEKQVFKASGYGLGEHGVMIGSKFTDPLSFKLYLCTRIEWDDEDTPVPVATVYGRETK
jgi:hypothetical protein